MRRQIPRFPHCYTNTLKRSRGERTWGGQLSNLLSHPVDPWTGENKVPKVKNIRDKSQWGIDVWPPTLHLRSSGGYVCLSGEPVEGPMDSILLSFSKSHVPPPYHHSPSLLKPITNASGKQSHTLTRIAYQPPLSQFTSHNSCGSSLVYMWHVFTWIQTIQVWAPLSIENMSQINQSFNQSIKRIIRFLFILTEFPILAVQIGYWDR